MPTAKLAPNAEADAENNEIRPQDHDAPIINPEDMRTHSGKASQLLKTLANEKRLMVLCLLVEGERSVGGLNAELDLSQSALSQHLAILRDSGLVNTRREAQTIYYTMAKGPARKIIETLHDIYCGSDSLDSNKPARG
jgi:DNA-binding transcriptional ArsR family regulator